MPEGNSNPLDPSARTVEQLASAIAALDDKFEVMVAGLKETFGIKFEGYEKAVILLQARADRQPTPDMVMAEVKALKELTENRFIAFQKQLEVKFDGDKVALDAALLTREKAIDKLETILLKQLDNIVINIGTLTKTFDDKITELKDRYNSSSSKDEGQAKGIDQRQQQSNSNRGFIFIAIGVGIAAASLMMSLMTQFNGATP